MSEDDFSKTPMTINEIRANKAEKANLWTPRDALISALRDVDSKKIQPLAAFIVLGHSELSTSDTYTHFWVSGRNNYEIAGLAMRGLYLFEHND